MGEKTDKEKPDIDPKKRRKMALGRGLDSLLPIGSGTEEKNDRNYFQCDIELIRPNRYQPRRRFADADLAELRDSIREQGILQPLLVRKDGLGYELVAGERRLRASRMAGLQQVPVVIKDISDEALLEMSIIENIQREDLDRKSTRLNSSHIQR
jgi:ParB family transcriptional regulator, chromosome partitioning protein